MKEKTIDITKCSKIFYPFFFFYELVAELSVGKHILAYALLQHAVMLANFVPTHF